MAFDQALQRFMAYYANRWPDVDIKTIREKGFERLVVSSSTVLRDQPGNHPQILHSGQVSDQVIVLIHGLTDSPYYMDAIAQDFAQKGFNVILPLLPAHGLKRPGRAFQQLKYTDWIQTVDAMCEIASHLGHNLSLGGFSTGGALSVHKAITDPDKVTGALFLFAAALDIGTVEQLVLQTEAGRMIARLRDQQLWLAKTVKDQLAMVLADQTTGQADEFFGTGENDYKYSVFFYEGASQLAEVIQEINHHYDKHSLKYGDITQPVFAAHATNDESALFRGVQLLVNNHPNNAVALFSVTGVAHEDFVLKAPILDHTRYIKYASANPFYAEMSQQMLTFIDRYLVAD